MKKEKKNNQYRTTAKGNNKCPDIYQRPFVITFMYPAPHILINSLELVPLSVRTYLILSPS